VVLKSPFSGIAKVRFSEHVLPRNKILLLHIESFSYYNNQTLRQDEGKIKKC
jgi:hypothetical protein